MYAYFNLTQHLIVVSSINGDLELLAGISIGQTSEIKCGRLEPGAPCSFNRLALVNLVEFSLIRLTAPLDRVIYGVDGRTHAQAASIEVVEIVAFELELDFRVAFLETLSTDNKLASCFDTSRYLEVS